MHGHHELVPVKRDVKYFQPAVQSMYPLLTYPFYMSTAEVSSTFAEVGGAAAFCLPWFHPQPTMQRSPKSWHNRTTFPFFAQVFSLQGFSIHLGSKCASCYKTCEWGIEQRVDFNRRCRLLQTSKGQDHLLVSPLPLELVWAPERERTDRARHQTLSTGSASETWLQCVDCTVACTMQI